MVKLMSYLSPTCLFDKVNEVHVGATVVNLKLNIDDETASEKYCVEEVVGIFTEGCFYLLTYL